MAESCFPFNSVDGDRKYKAEQWASYFSDFVSNGVYWKDSTALQVVADQDMQVVLKAGTAFIDGRRYNNDSDKIIELDSADGVLDRVDRIVVRCDYESRTITAEVVKGDYSSTAVATAAQRDDDVYELVLADIAVENGTASISQSDITDQRLDTDLCGVVTSLIEQVDTTVLLAQMEAWFAEYKVDAETEFDEWFENLQELISESTEAQLIVDVDNLKDDVEELQENQSTNDYTNADKTVVLSVTKPNLIMNSNFAVNQRGKTEYNEVETAYTVDRMKKDTYTRVVVFGNGIQLDLLDGALSTSDSSITQFVGAQKVSTAYTFLAQIDGTVHVLNAETDTDGNFITVYSDQLENAHLAVKGGDTYGNRVVVLNDAKTTPVTITWMYLAEGTYTAETMPAYVEPDYYDELDKCRRYYYKFPSGTIMGVSYTTTQYYTFCIVLPQEMISVPTISNMINIYSQGIGGNSAYAMSRDLTLSSGQYIWVSGTMPNNTTTYSNTAIMAISNDTEFSCET